ncbi:hypothetical protein A5893_13110 [Pedobacter psychrophilus]|uniref:Beta-mannosidase B n=1 Tax=Pedobacter psychrophilus TaxID=1826909 RepID=A0A179DD51_9SPHI|nr:glycoside hydrolase family 2 protein [Pedobacter psychrophilus]OAQ38971.1 hypothetical protein A5893_13110 [Pedobacter psychrophilus]
MNTFIRTIITITFIIFFKFSLAQTTKFDLTTNWTFSQYGLNQWLPASVPGCVHTDLLSNKKIEDPFYRSNERDLQWIGEKDWEYKTSFTPNAELLAKENQELVFKGLDTYADVYLNNQLILQTNNMHREWRVNCKSLLKNGANNLRIHFKSVFKIDVPKYLNAAYKASAFPNNDQGDMWLSIYARKAGYEYGWDWGPRLITSGIWRPITIVGRDKAKINNIQVVQNQIKTDKAMLNAVFNIESDTKQKVILLVKNGSKLLSKTSVNLTEGVNQISVPYEIKNPKLWWSNGLGEPNLYNLTYELQQNGEKLDSRAISTGLRTIKVIRENDKDGTSMYILLNGVKVFAKGSNYIPIDNFLNRVTPQRYEEVINTAKDANMNMLRVWGGGIYENDIFYNLCDKKGIMVWQDMMFACGMFPDDAAYIENVKQEVKDNVTRLRNHPSIALWCGNNENEIAWYQWGWKKKYSESVQKEYEKGMHQLFDVEIPSVISSLDTSRYYHPSSPSTGFNGIKGNEGDAHYYGVWNGNEPFESYNKNIARFMSEYGFQSFPEYKSIKEFTLPEDRKLGSDVLFFHQKAKNNETREDFGNKNIANYMDLYFKKYTDLNSFAYLSQVLQAKGINTAIEAHRRNIPYCMGTLYWQLNDCWPAASWSSTDYYGRWKALHYTVKKAYQKELISVMPEQGKLKVYIVSDDLKEQAATLSLKLMDLQGNILSEINKNLTIKPNSSHIYFEADSSVLLAGKSPKNVFWLIDVNKGKTRLARKEYFFEAEKELGLAKPEITSSIIKTGNQYFVDLKTNVLAKSVFLSLKDGDGFFSDNYFDLIPGEIKRVELTLKNGQQVKANDVLSYSLFDSYTVE